VDAAPLTAALKRRDALVPQLDVAKLARQINASTAGREGLCPVEITVYQGGAFEVTVPTPQTLPAAPAGK
jgi:ribosomal protein L11